MQVHWSFFSSSKLIAFLMIRTWFCIVSEKSGIWILVKSVVFQSFPHTFPSAFLFLVLDFFFFFNITLFVTWRWVTGPSSFNVCFVTFSADSGCSFFLFWHLWYCVWLGLNTKWQLTLNDTKEGWETKRSVSSQSYCRVTRHLWFKKKQVYLFSLLLFETMQQITTTLNVFM